METELLSVYDMPVFQLDFDAPELLPSAITDTISRYKLEEVEIGVNIAESQAWSSELMLTCQIQSLARSWEPVSLIRNSTTVFDGKTMFSFKFDFSDLGDPSTLSEQADLNCWAEGADDAGWSLVSSTGNSELDPWLEAPLNNVGPDLVLDAVELTGVLEAGENIRLSFLVLNSGEQLPTPFNATIELIQGEERTLVGRSVFYSMDANTAKSVKRSFTAPEGDWTLEITVDKEGLVWEIDETNNVWSTSVASSSNGFGALTMTLGGVGCLTLWAWAFSSDDERLLHLRRTWLPPSKQPAKALLPVLRRGRTKRSPPKRDPKQARSQRSRNEGRPVERLQPTPPKQPDVARHEGRQSCESRPFQRRKRHRRWQPSTWQRWVYRQRPSLPKSEWLTIHNCPVGGTTSTPQRVRSTSVRLAAAGASTRTNPSPNSTKNLDAYLHEGSTPP